MIIGIVGLGLIGGSLAHGSRSVARHQVYGLDTDPGTMARAMADGVICGELNDAALGNCELLLLALYPQAAVDFMVRNGDRISPGACVVDLCGVKQTVRDGILPIAFHRGFHYVGGHPMAGREVSGYEAAHGKLFTGASMLLCPEEDTPPETLAMLEDFFLSIGFGGVTITNPEEHDRVIAYTSQLAHVLSNAYVKSPNALCHAQFSGGSFQDLTRVAFLHVPMWTELFMLNRDHLIAEIDELCQRLATYAEALRQGDAQGLSALLQEGCDWKERIMAGKDSQA
ncbi:MAG: prephenate dehydrogenase [Clostridiales bacterium]|nr:prephenate dehydrogenase [Clostridiales bacterium]